MNVAGVDISLSPTIKSLGVVLDSRLTFSDHVTQVAKSCNYHISAIRYIRHLLSIDTAQTFACSLVNSRLDYCNSLLYRASSSVLDKLQRVQNSAARLVCQAGRRSHSSPLLSALHWLPVRRRIDYKLAVLTYKVRQTKTPAYLERLLFPRQTTRQLRSSNLPLFSVPAIRTELSRRAFQYSAPTVWNSLPENVTESETVSTFKKKLKTFLFNLAFSD